MFSQTYRAQDVSRKLIFEALAGICLGLLLLLIFFVVLFFGGGNFRTDRKDR